LLIHKTKTTTTTTTKLRAPLLIDLVVV